MSTPFWAETVDQVLGRLGVTPEGLAPEEALQAFKDVLDAAQAEQDVATAQAVAEAHGVPVVLIEADDGVLPTLPLVSDE